MRFTTRPGGAGLQRHQRVAEHLRREEADVLRLEGDAHAALLARVGFLELALAAAAGVDLALHRPHRAAELGGGVDRFFGRERGKAARHGHAEALEDGFALVFVDVHEAPPDRGPSYRARPRPSVSARLSPSGVGLVLAIGDLAGGDAGADLRREFFLDRPGLRACCAARTWRRRRARPPRPRTRTCRRRRTRSTSGPMITGR